MIEWPAIAAIATACMVAGAFLRHFFDLVFGAGGKVTELERVNTLLLAQGARVEMIISKFSEHEKDDARAFATLETLVKEASRQQTAIESRFLKTLEDLADKVDALGERMDRFLEKR